MRKRTKEYLAIIHFLPTAPSPTLLSRVGSALGEKETPCGIQVLPKELRLLENRFLFVCFNYPTKVDEGTVIYDQGHQLPLAKKTLVQAVATDTLFKLQFVSERYETMASETALYRHANSHHLLFLFV